jgi:hypothetical protein
MTVGRARAILSTAWVLLALPLIAIIFLQTVGGKYEEWEDGFGWLIPLVFPILSLMFATWTVAQTRKDRVVVANKHVFYLSLVASIFYLVLLYVVVGKMPRKDTAFAPDAKAFQDYVEHVMRPSLWYLGTIQAVVVVVIGKFFLEHIPEE